MNPSAPTPAPLHDIVGPVWFFPYPIWMVVAAAIVLLLLAIVLVWGIRRLLARKHVPTPRERALAALEHLRRGIGEADSYAFGIAVSDAVRSYVHEQHGLAATKQTSLEFLESIRDNPVFSANEKAGLSVFLERSDLLKFAREAAGENDRIELLETAGRLVRGEVQPGQKNASA